MTRQWAGHDHRKDRSRSAGNAGHDAGITGHDNPELLVTLARNTHIEHFTGIEPKALWTDITLGVSVARKVTRAAVVADAGWIRASMHLARLFTKAEVKTFHVNELEQARVWINA